MFPLIRWTRSASGMQIIFIIDDDEEEVIPHRVYAKKKLIIRLIITATNEIPPTFKTIME